MLLAALVLAGCGSAAEQTNVPASSGEDGTFVEPADAGTDVDESDLKPPPILLISDTGKQEAVQGSFCVDYLDEASGVGQAMCADAAGPTFPAAATSVARHDTVTFVLPDAILRMGSTVTIRPLGCIDQKVGKIALGPGSDEYRWRVDLEHGAYQLDVFARFRADDGRSGDVSGSLGLTVAGPKKWDALGVGASSARCRSARSATESPCNRRKRSRCASPLRVREICACAAG